MYPYSDRPPEEPYQPGNYPQGQYQPPYQPQYPSYYRRDPEPVYPVLKIMGFVFFGLIIFSMLSHVFFLWPLFIFLPLFIFGRRARYRRYYRPPYQQWQSRNNVPPYYYPPQNQNWPGYNSPQSSQQPPSYGWPDPNDNPGEDPRWK